MKRARRLCVSCVTVMLSACAGAVHAQSELPAAFVANNGNIEGSVTSFTIDAQGVPTFVQKLITGSGSGSPGNNAYSISITPNGRLLAASHATAAGITEKVTIIRVNPDATMTQLGQFNTPDSPLDLQWLSDTHIAVTETKSSGTNRVRVYSFDEASLAWTLVDTETTTNFTSKITLMNDGRFLYAQQSPLQGSGAVTAFSVDAATGQLTFQGVVGTNGYPLGPGTTPDGRFLYAAGGISGNILHGFTIDPVTGVLTEIPGMPFSTPDSSPKQCVGSPDGNFLYVGHGSASTVRAFSIDQATGSLASLPYVFDVGIQGALGDIAVLRLPTRDLLLFTDKDYSTIPSNNNFKGLFSYTINTDGSFTQNAPLLETQGVSPNDISVWAGAGGLACDTIDFNGDGLLPDVLDIQDFLSVFAGGVCDGQLPTDPPCSTDIDFNNDGLFPDTLDISSLVSVFGGGACL